MKEEKPIQITPLIQRQNEEGEKKKEEEEILQSKENTGQISEVFPNLEPQIQSLKGGG